MFSWESAATICASCLNTVTNSGMNASSPLSTFTAKSFFSAACWAR